MISNVPFDLKKVWWMFYCSFITLRGLFGLRATFKPFPRTFFFRFRRIRVSIAGKLFSKSFVNSFITSLCNCGWQIAISSISAKESGVPSICFSRYFGVVIYSTQRRTPKPTGGNFIYWNRFWSSYNGVFTWCLFRDLWSETAP